MGKNTKTLFVVAVSFATVTFASGGKVSLTSHSYKEISITDKNGKKITKLVDTKKVLPGDTIMYHNVVDNSTDKAVKNMVVNNPIPKEVQYIANSAKCQSPCTVLFSVDNGKSFATPDKLTITINNKKQIATPKQYTNIRWILNQPLPKHQKTVVSYRARLK